jgi:hypothetical protein
MLPSKTTGANSKSDRQANLPAALMVTQQAASKPTIQIGGTWRAFGIGAIEGTVGLILNGFQEKFTFPRRKFLSAVFIMVRRNMDLQLRLSPCRELDAPRNCHRLYTISEGILAGRAACFEKYLLA